MIPRLRSLEDVRQVVGRLPYACKHDKGPTAAACRKALRQLNSLGKVPTLELAALTQELDRFVGR